MRRELRYTKAHGRPRMGGRAAEAGVTRYAGVTLGEIGRLWAPRNPATAEGSRQLNCSARGM